MANLQNWFTRLLYKNYLSHKLITLKDFLELRVWLGVEPNLELLLATYLTNKRHSIPFSSKKPLMLFYIHN